MTRAQVLDALRTILPKEFELSPDAIVPEARLKEDLDLDSIDAVALAARLEQETGLFLKEERLKHLRTVQDVIDVVHELAEQRSA